jgi:hypothetical protein
MNEEATASGSFFLAQDEDSVLEEIRREIRELRIERTLLWQEILTDTG